MLSKVLMVFLCLTLLSMIIRDTNAYRLDQRQIHTDDNEHLSQPEFIAKIQKLLAAVRTVHAKDDDHKDFATDDHDIQTRLAINRRPGLIRLRKSY
ncbi:hypothetical protein I4U23_026668 [Adineta vaga]|nr:hypothetical protein I4U23_026668 [Adineta vaga]